MTFNKNRLLYNDHAMINLLPLAIISLQGVDVLFDPILNSNITI